MQKKTWWLGGVILFLGLMTGGCSGKKEQGDLDRAFMSIASLEYENALTFFETAARQGEDSQQVARGKGIALLGLTRYQEAIEEFLRALSYSDANVDEFDFDTNYYLAAAYFKEGMPKEAEAVYTAILNLQKEKEAYYLRGVVRLVLNELKQAKEDFDEAIRLAPMDYDLRIEVYQALAEKGYVEEGKAYLQAALGNNGNKLSDQDKGRFSYYLEDYQSARSYLESQKGEKNSESTLLLGQTYEKLGDYHYAASIYSNFLADHKEDVKILNRLGMCKLEAGDAQTALDCFNRALEIGDSSLTQVLKFNQIVAYEYLGEFDRAGVLMKTYLQAYPDDPDALREYEFLKSR